MKLATTAPGLRPRLAWVARAPLVQMLCAGLFVGTGFLAAQLGLNGLRAAGLLAGSLQLNLAALALFVPFTYGAYRLYASAIEHRLPSELSRGGALPELGAGLLGGIAPFSLTIGGLWLLGSYYVTGSNPWLVLLAALAGAVVSAFVQELLFRGILFRIAESSLGTWLAVALSALLFGAAHLASPGASALSTLAVLLAGALFAGALVLTGRLWLAIGLHAAWDFANDGVFGVGVAGTSGQPIPGLLRAELRGPAVLTGGAFGVEASIVAVVVVLAAVFVLFVNARRRGRIVAPFWQRPKLG